MDYVYANESFGSIFLHGQQDERKKLFLSIVYDAKELIYHWFWQNFFGGSKIRVLAHMNQWIGTWIGVPSVPQEPIEMKD